MVARPQIGRNRSFMKTKKTMEMKEMAKREEEKRKTQQLWEEKKTRQWHQDWLNSLTLTDEERKVVAGGVVTNEMLRFI